MYLQLAKCIFSQQFQYRESVLFKLIGNFLRVYIQICIWRALLLYQDSGVGFSDMVLYTVASFILGQLSSTSVASELSDKVKSGSIAIDLIRPVSLKWYLFWEQISANLFQLLFAGMPVVLFVFLIWTPAALGGLHMLLAAVSAALAVMLVFYLQYTIGLLVFWFKDGTYARMLTNGLIDLFSGRVIPLWFYPAFLMGICEFLPFRFMVYEPIAILLGRYELRQTCYTIGMQIFCVLVFTILEKYIWHRVQTQIEVQGG